jgi:hypothetical protein
MCKIMKTPPFLVLPLITLLSPCPAQGVDFTNTSEYDIHVSQWVVTLVEAKNPPDAPNPDQVVQQASKATHTQTIVPAGAQAFVPALAASPSLASAPTDNQPKIIDNVPKGSALRREIIVAIREHFYGNNRQMGIQNPDGLVLSFREFYAEPSTDRAAVVLTRVTGNMEYLNPLPIFIFLNEHPDSTWKVDFWVSLPLMSREQRQTLLATGLSPQFLRR